MIVLDCSLEGAKLTMDITSLVAAATAVYVAIRDLWILIRKMRSK